MNRSRLLLGSIIASVVVAWAIAPFLGVFGADDAADADSMSFSIQSAVVPNIVIAGDTVTYVIRVENTGLERADITVTGMMGAGNETVLRGVSGGKLTYVGGSEQVTGIEGRYVTGSIVESTGVTLRNVYPGQPILIQYRAVASDERMDATSYSPVRIEATTDTGATTLTAVRILGNSVTDTDIACSSPAYGEFPDPSDEAQLICYSNNLVDTGTISGPEPQSAEVAPQLAIQTGQCSYSATRMYRDVPTSNSLQCSISFATDMHIMQGYDNQTFRPNSGITRAEFAAAVLRAAKIDTQYYEGQPSRYSDVDGHALASAINTATALGIVSGFGDGSFQPDSLIRRDEATKVVLRAFQLQTSESTPSMFRDVAATDSLAIYVNTAAALGAVEGMNGNFYPDSTITRAEVAKILVKMTGFLTDGTSAFAG